MQEALGSSRGVSYQSINGSKWLIFVEQTSAFHSGHKVFSSSPSTGFPAAGLSTSHIRADWLHYWSSAAKWAQLLITYLVAA